MEPLTLACQLQKQEAGRGGEKKKSVTFPSFGITQSEGNNSTESNPFTNIFSRLKRLLISQLLMHKSSEI